MHVGLSESNHIAMILLMHLLPVLHREAGKKPDESRCNHCAFPAAHTKEVTAVCPVLLLGLELNCEVMAVGPIA